jgi:Tol biopolymer transport system component
MVVALLALAVPADATFPGRNGKLAVTLYGIDTLNPDGSAFTSLAPGYSPAWSPDGKQIAFISGQPFITGHSDVYVMDENGLNVRRLTNSRTQNGDPSWSPDGQQIVFTHDYTDPAAANATTDLYVVRADGTNLTNLTNTPDVKENQPAWSSTGKIAFVSGNNIFVMNGDGTNRARVTDYPPNGHWACCPDWSPDGSKLAYSRGPSAEPPNYPYDNTVRVVNADGTGDRAVAYDKWGPVAAWSPDGRYLVLGSQPIGLSLLDLASGMRSSIPNPPSGAIESAADWQPIPEPKRGDFKNAAKFCKAERAFLGESAFRQKYGTNKNGKNAFGKCVSQNH